MKKCKSFFVFASFFLFILFFGCKSSPVVNNEVNALDLLDNQSSFYLRIPSTVDETLISRVVQNCIDGISEKDANLVASRIDVVYAGLTRKRNNTTFQIAIENNFPKFAVERALKNSNWKNTNMTLKDNVGKNVTYTIYTDENIFASFPSVKISCIGRNVPSMIERFNSLANCIPEDEAEFNVLSDEIFDFLNYDKKNPDNKIKYYASKPQSFLTTLTGATLNFNLKYVRGIIESDSKRDDQFIMSLEFEFINKKFIPLGKGTLSVAFGLTDSDIIQQSETNLLIQNIKIAKKEFYKILVL